MFKVLFYQPTFKILIVLYNLLRNNLGLAIIAVAILSRLITYPLTKSQIKAAEKGKNFQKKYDAIKKKYSKNKEKLNEELMKLQSKYLPSQLAGCLPIIILIILLIQVRGGIRNLVDRGWNAFNEVAYFQSLKKDEDIIKYDPEEDLELGEHTLKIYLKSEHGNEIEKTYSFEVVEDVDERKQELIDEENNKSEEEKEKEKEDINSEMRSERATEFSIYSDFFEESAVNIPVSKTFIFVTNSSTEYITSDNDPTFNFYIRPPSNQTVLSDETKVYFDDIEVTEGAYISQGERINLDLIGIDLSKVAADFSWSDPEIMPYIILALLVGGSQFATTRILTGIKSFDKDKKKKKPKKLKKKKEDEGMPDMAELMSMTNKQMMFMFPILTIVTSLGYWGGANIFPSGLSVFWTVQSLFVIIQQLIMNREKVADWVNIKLNKKNK